MKSYPCPKCNSVVVHVSHQRPFKWGPINIKEKLRNSCVRCCYVWTETVKESLTNVRAAEIIHEVEELRGQNERLRKELRLARISEATLHKEIHAHNQVCPMRLRFNK